MGRFLNPFQLSDTVKATDAVASASTTATPSVSGTATPVTESDSEDAGNQVGSPDSIKWTSIKKEDAVSATA
jgi:hypothetical protein